MAEDTPQLQIEADWLDATDTPIYFSNFFAVQPMKDEFVLTFANGTLPIYSKALTLEQAQQMRLKVKSFVRVGMTPGRLIEFIQLAQRQLKAYSDSLDKEPN